MTNSLHTFRYQVFRKLIVDVRRQARLRQTELAEKLGKPQSFVSKYERGERRLDFIEFMSLAEALSLDVHNFLAAYTDKIAAQNLLESVTEAAEGRDDSQIVCLTHGSEVSREE